MAIVIATGTNIVRVSGGIATNVGIYDASDIDLDITRNTPYSNPEEALTWINDLLTNAGITSPTATQEHHAVLAQRWYSWIYYWQMSKQSESCPDDCKDPASFAAKLKFARQQLCSHLTAIGLTYPPICDLADGIYIASTVTKFC